MESSELFVEPVGDACREDVEGGLCEDDIFRR